MNVYQLTEPNKRYGTGNIYYVIAKNEVDATKTFCKQGFLSSDFKAELFDIKMLNIHNIENFEILCNIKIKEVSNV